MRAIPRTYLGQTADFYKKTSVNEYGVVTYETKVSLSYVRIEPITATSLQNLGELKDTKLLMFYDCKNSLPVSQVFSELDKITYNGVDYIVRSVSIFTGHHYEVYLK